MLGGTNFITEARWTDIMLIWFVLVDDAYHTLEQHYGAWRRRGPTPQFSDSEVITVALLIDTFYHGHEALGLSFIRQYHADWFPHLPSDGHFNERRTLLGPLIDQIRRQISAQAGLLDATDAVRLIDSAPIFVATYGRGSVNQTLCGAEYFGVAASQGAKVFGLRLTITTTTDQVLDRWLLAPAARHDSATLADALAETTECFVLADGAYRNPFIQALLHDRQGIDLLAPPRQDSVAPWPAASRRLVNRVRRRIETALSILTTVFDIEHPRARSLHGLIARISTRLLAYNLCFLRRGLLAQLPT
jgi:hypothetical protein